MNMNSTTNDPLKIDKISIEKFRRFKKVEFEIGKNITLIAGQNGTSKSTLLGMLCQPFSFGVLRGKTAGSLDSSEYTDNYHGVNLLDFRDITGSHFIYECKDVFRLSNLHDTVEKKYSYRLHLSGTTITKNSPIFKDGLLVRAPKKVTGGIRFVAGPRASNEAGEGNCPHPVIYLGLNRLWPMALVKKLDLEHSPKINDGDKNWYIKKYNQILLLEEHDNTTEFVKTGSGLKGDFIGTSSKDYNSESCSAGQDNLGQILTSILSFRYLKSELGNKYQGGILLIDELDTTFHAVAQVALLETLIEESKKLNIQIIATTHSMYLLERVFHSSLKKAIKVLYLKKSGKNVIDSGYTTFGEIKCNLNVDAVPEKKNKIKKVTIFFEDSVGKNMFFGILGNSLHLRKYLTRIEMGSFDAGSLKNLAVLSAKVPELKNVIFIPDGDIKKEIKTHENILFLPGDSRPETLLYDNLKETESDAPFWGECKSEFNAYGKQFSITKHEAQYGSPPIPNRSKNAKDWYKKWYQSQRGFWGRTENIAWKKWANDNKSECADFCKLFLKILKRLSPEPIPESLFSKILERYK